MNNRKLSGSFKILRHNLNKTVLKGFPAAGTLIKERESARDVGRTLYASELKRRNINDVFFANLARVKESVRVLEEFGKLFSIEAAVRLKGIRYGLYELEKKSAALLARLRNLK